MSHSTKTSFANRVGGFFDLLSSAAATANAVEAGRAPKAHHLKTLGIDADQFRSIGR